MTEYVTVQELLSRHTTESQLSTGSPELDKLIGASSVGCFTSSTGKNTHVRLLDAYKPQKNFLVNTSGRNEKALMDDAQAVQLFPEHVRSFLKVGLLGHVLVAAYDTLLELAI